MFVHLHCHSPFSFLDGAASIESLTAQASMYQMPALALTDHNTIAGLPEFHKWAAVYGVKPISGAEITLDDESHLTVLAETKTGYANLCKLLTLAHDGPLLRKQPRVRREALFEHAVGLILLSGCRRGRIATLLRNRRYIAAKRLAETYQTAFKNHFFLELQADAYPQTERVNADLAELGETLGIPIVAASNVHYLTPEQLPVHDILTCIRLGCDIRSPHGERPLNATRWFHGPDEALVRFRKYPEAIHNTMRIAERCQVVLNLHEPLFPTYELPPDRTNAAAYLRDLTYSGARNRYARVDDMLRQRIDHELTIIEQLGYVDYFLVVWDIVNYARQHRIRCAGRGSAADSAVAYCLYITDVDAAGRGLLFERFMSLERAEKPDIDIDFDSRRRDEVMDYVYQKYGKDHVARVATYQSFRGRSAIREVGAALGIPEGILDTLAKRVPWMAHADRLAELFERVPELRDFAAYRKQLPWLWKLAAQISGFPRHFGMHVGGLVVSRRPLFEITSLQPSAKGEWMTPFDKDAVEEVGLVKLDLLSLRTMSAVEGTIVLRERQGSTLDYDAIPLDDEATFAMLGQGDTIGVFQLESPAQRSLQARLHPDGLEDIVASVALIRPGPIKGNMVDPFLERRKGNEPVSYLHPKLEPILGKTYGVVLFQEQVIEIATAIANFTPGEADQLRRVMSKARSTVEMERIGKHFLEKAAQAGVDPEVASTIFSYIQGYASYGFCEAHAAAFAATAYKTAYLVRHYPAEFYASILNQYPMGYYPVHVICAEARRRGIRILGVDVNSSHWECEVEQGAIRLGFCILKGFRQSTSQKLVEERLAAGPYQSVPDCLRRVPSLDRLTVERMIRVGTFDSLYPASRRFLLWELPGWIALRSLPEEPLFGSPSVLEQAGCGEAYIPNAPHSVSVGQEPSDLEQMDLTLAEKLRDEYHHLGVGMSGHWLSCLRPWLQREGYETAERVLQHEDGDKVFTAGLLVRPHRPPTKSGKTVVFFTVEDETGLIDATMFEAVYHKSGAILFTPYGRLIGMEGVIQRRGGRPQLLVNAVWPLIERTTPEVSG